MRTFNANRLRNIVALIKIFKENLEKIRQSWDDIEEAIFKGTMILKEWSISEKHLKSKNSIIPIFYYFYKGGKSDSNSKQNLKKYFLITNIKNHFSSHGDTMLSKIRNAMRDEKTKNFMIKILILRKLKKETNHISQALLVKNF